MSDQFFHNILWAIIVAISVINGCTLWQLNRIHVELVQLLRVLLTVPGARNEEDDGP